MTTRTLWLLGVLAMGACAARPTAVPLAQATADVSLATPVSERLVQRMGAVALVFGQAGFRHGDTELNGFLPNGARRTERLTLPPHTCMAVVAVASAAMLDLDAGLYTSEGEALVEDDNTDARPVLSLCSGAHARDVYYALHAYQGGGAYLVRSFLRAQRPDDRSVSADQDELNATWAALARRLAARGFDEEGAAVALEVRGADALRVAVPVEVASCYAFVAEVDPSLEGAALGLLDLSGRELSRAVFDGGLLALQFCADKTQDLVLSITASHGHGGLRLSRFRGTEARVGGHRALWLGEPRH